MAVLATDPTLPLTEDLQFQNFVVSVAHDFNVRSSCAVVAVDRPCFLASLSLELNTKVASTRYIAVKAAAGTDIAAAITATNGLIGVGDGAGAAGAGQFIDGNPAGTRVSARVENGGTYRFDLSKIRFNKGDILIVGSTNASDVAATNANFGVVTATFVRDD